MTVESQKYLDPKVLNKITKLEIKARMIAEGFLGGMHKSPLHGASVEFAEHREYVPGDDIRHIDWRVWAKTDRFVIKQYEEETSLHVHLVLDASESMRYASDQVSKYQYASYVAASIAYMVLKQRDSAGLAVFDEQLTRQIPSSNNPGHIRPICHEIEVAQNGRKKTQLGPVLHRFAEKLSRRSLIVLLSDLFGAEDDILSGLKHLRHQRHDVIVMQILDKFELTFPFEQMTEFVGMEGYENLLLDPRPLRQAYVDEITRFNQYLRRQCTRNRIDFVTLTTDQMLDVALSTYLATRAASMTQGKGGKRI